MTPEVTPESRPDPRAEPLAAALHEERGLRCAGATWPHQGDIEEAAALLAAIDASEDIVLLMAYGNPAEPFEARSSHSNAHKPGCPALDPEQDTDAEDGWIAADCTCRSSHSDVSADCPCGGDPTAAAHTFDCPVAGRSPRTGLRAALERKHQLAVGQDFCAWCGQGWPCDTRQALAAPSAGADTRPAEETA